jgi:2-amino-4-hydroxy-6-hydroxymethyldihydropteridine diphosphokinase
MRMAATLISQRVGEVTLASSLYETAPWGGIEQPAFLNQVLEIQTRQAPEEVLRLILDIEHELGRVRYERWGARHLDVDLLYYGALHMDTARLTVPHPRLHERRFTLVPLVEIAPDFVHPVLTKTNKELLEACPDQEEVSLFESF